MSFRYLYISFSVCTLLNYYFNRINKNFVRLGFAKCDHFFLDTKYSPITASHFRFLPVPSWKIIPLPIFTGGVLPSFSSFVASIPVVAASSISYLTSLSLSLADFASRAVDLPERIHTVSPPQPPPQPPPPSSSSLLAGWFAP